jgi:mRNA interferase MazF
MHQIVLDAEAGQVSAGLTRRGVAANARVHVLVEVLDTSDLPMSAIAAAGKGFDWLADEPELYSDADLVERTG